MQNRYNQWHARQVPARQLPLITIKHAKAALRGFSFMHTSIGFFLIALAWLVPNTSQPWIAFWTETVACVGLLLVAHSFFWKKQLPLPRTSLAWICTALALLFIDWILRENTYFGDYIAGYIYISSFFIAILTGMYIKKYNVFLYAYPQHV